MLKNVKHWPHIDTEILKKKVEKVTCFDWNITHFYYLFHHESSHLGQNIALIQGHQKQINKDF